MGWNESSENLRLILIIAVQNVRFWHKADISRLSFNVRFSG